MSGAAHTPGPKRITLFGGIVLFLASWHLFGGLNDNVTSRAAMITAIVEHGTPYIDAYADLAGDKAFVDGHYYSEKAPLPTLIMTPVWWAVRTTGLAGPPEADTLDPALIRLAGFLFGSMPFALIVTLIWLRLRARTRGFPAAIAATCACFGSFLFLFSGVFFSHLPGAALLLLAFIARERGRMATCGFLAGAAVLCEYTLAVFPAVWVLLHLRPFDARAIGRTALGALPAAILFIAYNLVLFGRPVVIGYTHQVGYDFLHETAGFGPPSLHHLWHLVLTDYRGLLFYAPVLLPAIIAFLTTPRTVKWFMDPVIVPSVFSMVLLSGFGGWWGGWTYGPRYLTAAAALLLFHCLPAPADRRWARTAFFPLALFGLICAFAAKDTVGFSLPTEYHHPMIEVVWPAIGTMHASDQWPVLLGLAPGLCTALFLALFTAGLFALHRIDAPQRGTA